MLKVDKEKEWGYCNLNKSTQVATKWAPSSKRNSSRKTEKEETMQLVLKMTTQIKDMENQIESLMQEN